MDLYTVYQGRILFVLLLLFLYICLIVEVFIKSVKPWVSFLTLSFFSNKNLKKEVCTLFVFGGEGPQSRPPTPSQPCMTYFSFFCNIWFNFVSKSRNYYNGENGRPETKPIPKPIGARPKTKPGWVVFDLISFLSHEINIMMKIGDQRIFSL